jgi:Right handed beta helix region
MSHVRTLVVAVWVLVEMIAVPAAARPGPAQGHLGSIDATGRSDVTAGLQALFDRTPDGGVIQLEAGADYRVEGTLVLEDRHQLRIEGNGARIFATTRADRTRSQLQLVGGSNLVVRNLEIQGANPHAGLEERAYVAELEAQHAIDLLGVSDVELDRVNLHDTYGDFVYLGRRDDQRWSQRVWIHDSTFARSGRQGIAVVAARDVVIEHNRFTDMRRATIDLEPNGPSWGANNIHVIDNRIGPGRLLFVAAAGSGPVDSIVIARNTLQGRALYVWVDPPEGSRRQRFWVVDNTTDTMAMDEPVQFTRTDGAVVHGNRQAIEAPDAFVRSTDSCGVAVTDNAIAPSSRALEGQSRECSFNMPVAPPAPPAVAGRGRPAPPPPPTTAAATTTTPSTTTVPATSTTTLPTSAPPPTAGQLTASDSEIGDDEGGDGVAEPVVALATVLSALACVGGLRAFNAWRARR